MSKIIKAGQAGEHLLLAPPFAGRKLEEEALRELPPADQPRPAGKEDDEKQVAETILMEAREAAERIVAEAEQRAAEIISAAEQKVASLKGAAREEGYSRGYAEGKQVVEKHFGPMLEELSSATEEAATARDRALQAAEADVLKLAIAIAEKIIRREVAKDSYTTARLIEESLQRLEGATEVAVRLNPSEYEELSSSFASVVDRFARIEKFTLVPDSNVERGGCIVDTDFGAVDAGLETRLVAVSRALLEVMQDG